MYCIALPVKVDSNIGQLIVLELDVLDFDLASHEANQSINQNRKTNLYGSCQLDTTSPPSSVSGSRALPAPRISSKEQRATSTMIDHLKNVRKEDSERRQREMEREYQERRDKRAHELAIVQMQQQMQQQMAMFGAQMQQQTAMILASMMNQPAAGGSGSYTVQLNGSPHAPPFMQGLFPQSVTNPFAPAASSHAFPVGGPAAPFNYGPMGAAVSPPHFRPYQQAAAGFERSPHVPAGHEQPLAHEETTPVRGATWASRPTPELKELIVCEKDLYVRTPLGHSAMVMGSIYGEVPRARTFLP
jgi:hypothetical protein